MIEQKDIELAKKIRVELKEYINQRNVSNDSFSYLIYIIDFLILKIAMLQRRFIEKEK